MEFSGADDDAPPQTAQSGERVAGVSDSSVCKKCVSRPACYPPDSGDQAEWMTVSHHAHWLKP